MSQNIDYRITQSGLRYSGRVSPRAKRCTIKIWSSYSVEVVVPKGFDQDLVPKMLDQQMSRILQEQKKAHAQEKRYNPETISLKSIGETWNILYRSGSTGERHILELPGSNLHIIGYTDDISGIARELNAWTHKQAMSTLPKWIEFLSSQINQTYNKITIKRQKTLWGSCSRKRNINLNQNLLFLPPEMVNYVLLHELSHLEHMNHQQCFWDLLESRFKGSRQMATQVRKAGTLVPDWAHR